MPQGWQRPMTAEEANRLRWSPAEIAQELAVQRRRAGLSAEQLAEHLHVSPSLITKYERGTFPIVAARVISWLFADLRESQAQHVARARSAEACIREVDKVIRRYHGENG